jgi:hypothetical protein
MIDVALYFRITESSWLPTLLNRGIVEEVRLEVLTKKELICIWNDRTYAINNEMNNNTCAQNL